MPEARAAEIHPVQMTKILRDVFQDPQLAHKSPRQEGAGRLFCITGARDSSRSREFHRHSIQETYFQKLSEKN